MTNDLLIRFLKGEASLEESRQVKKWLDENSENKMHLQKLHENYLAVNLYTYDTADFEKQIERISRLALNKKTRSYRLLYYAASAAAVILLLIWGVTSSDYLKEKVQQTAAIQMFDYKKEGGLTLSDGRFFPAKSFENHLQITKKKIRINEKEFDLGSVPNGNQTLVVKNGTTARVELPDGSTVYLNAGSIFSFPLEFKNEARTVYLNGEGYFDVKKRNGASFTVITQMRNIEVLGTSFNVCAYSKDELFFTVLVKGSVAVKSKNEQTLISPNQAYLYNKTFDEQKVIEIDTSPYVSWTHNQLLFNNENLGTLLNRVARFYGVEICVAEQNMENYQISGSLKLRPKIEETLSILLQTLPTGKNRPLIINQNGSTILIQ